MIWPHRAGQRMGNSESFERIVHWQGCFHSTLFNTILVSYQMHRGAFCAIQGFRSITLPRHPQESCLILIRSHPLCHVGIMWCWPDFVASNIVEMKFWGEIHRQHDMMTSGPLTPLGLSSLVPYLFSGTVSIDAEEPLPKVCTFMCHPSGPGSSISPSCIHLCTLMCSSLTSSSLHS